MTLTVELPRMAAEAADQDLVGRARSLFPQLRERAAEVEEARRIPDTTIAELQSAGLFKLFAPRRFGGHQTSVRAFLDVSAEVARGCGSTGWVTALINICGWLGSLYSDEAQQEVWGADPEARIAGVLTPSATAAAADGGMVLNGNIWLNLFKGFAKLLGGDGLLIRGELSQIRRIAVESLLKEPLPL